MSVKTRETDGDKCVESCMTATVRECTCECGGRNHGILKTERLEQFEEVEISEVDSFRVKHLHYPTSETQLVMVSHDRPAWRRGE